MANPSSLKPFTKGDARINRKGRPRNPPALRELTLDILTEPATGADGAPVLVNGKQISKVEAIVRAAVTSKDPRQRQWAIELGYGKPVQQVELAGKDGGPIQTENKTALDLSRLTDDELRTMRTLRAKVDTNAPADAG